MIICRKYFFKSIQSKSLANKTIFIYFPLYFIVDYSAVIVISYRFINLGAIRDFKTSVRIQRERERREYVSIASC